MAAVRGGAVIEHRAEQPLRRDRVARVDRALDQAGGEPATRTLPADREALAVEAECLRVGAQPPPPSPVIVDRRSIVEPHRTGLSGG